jgi:hypothetical protein
MVHGDAIEPSTELGLASKARESLDGFEQNILCGVFSICAAMKHAERQIKEPGKMAGEQEFELIAFASFRAGDEVYIRIAGEVIEERVWECRRF